MSNYYLPGFMNGTGETLLQQFQWEALPSYSDMSIIPRIFSLP